MVGKERLELSRVTPLVPKTSASTNSATRPLVLDVCQGVEFRHTPFLSSREVDDLEALKSVAIMTNCLVLPSVILSG